MSEKEIKKYLASIGSKGGKAGAGESKLRGGKAYYKRISQLAAKARQAKTAASKSPKSGKGNK